MKTTSSTTIAAVSCSGGTSRGRARSAPVAGSRTPRSRGLGDEEERDARLVRQRVDDEHDGDERQRDVRPEEEQPPVDRVGDGARVERHREQRHERGDAQEADEERRARGEPRHLERIATVVIWLPIAEIPWSRTTGGESWRAAERASGRRLGGEAVPSEELLALGRSRGSVEEAARAPPEIGEVDAALLRGGGKPLGEPERVVEEGVPAAASCPISCRIVRLGARRDDGVRDPSTQTRVRLPPRSSPRSGSSA